MLMFNKPNFLNLKHSSTEKKAFNLKRSGTGKKAFYFDIISVDTLENKEGFVMISFDRKNDYCSCMGGVIEESECEHITQALLQIKEISI